MARRLVGCIALLVVASGATAAREDAPGWDEQTPAWNAPVADPADPAEEQPPAEAPAAEAEPPQAAPPRLDTLSRIMWKVWTEHPQVRQAEQVVRAAGYDVSGARAGYFPFLQVTSTFAEDDIDNDSNVDLVLPLWSGGSTGADVDIAKGQEQSAAAELMRTRLQLGQQTVETYMGIVEAQEAAVQWASYTGALRKLLATIRRRAEKGVAPEADVQTALTRLRQAEAGEEANRANLISGRAQLASLIDATPETLDWPLEENLLSDAEVAKAGERKAHHPDHLFAKADLEVFEASARRSRAALWPELQFAHRWELEGSGFDVASSANLLLLRYESTSNGLRALRGFQADRERVESARAQLAATERTIASTIEIDRAQLRAAAAQLVVQNQAAEAAGTLVESFMRQYEVGRRSWLEVLNAQREAHDALLQSIAVRRNYWQANCRLALDSMYWQRLTPPAEDAASGDTTP